MIPHKKILKLIAVNLIILIGLHSSAAIIRHSQFMVQKIYPFQGFLQGFFSNLIHVYRAFFDLQKNKIGHQPIQKYLNIFAKLKISSYFYLIVFDNNRYLKQIKQSLIASNYTFKINSNENRETLTTACYLKATGICAAFNLEIPAGFRTRRSM